MNKLKPFIVFSFCGQSVQYISMGLELYNNKKVFKETSDKIDNYFKENYTNGISMLQKLRSIDEKDHEFNNQLLVHINLFIFQISLYELFKSEGIIPSFVYGVSCGELSAVYCSGLLDFETTCNLLFQRAMLIEKVIDSGRVGTIVVLFTNEEFYRNHILKKYQNIEFGGNITSNIIFVGGIDLEEIEKLLIECKNELLINFARIPVATSFHTSIMEFIKDDIMGMDSNLFKNNEINIPILSSVDGELFNTTTHKYDKDYFYKNQRNPINNLLAIQNIIEFINQDYKNGLNNGNVLFIELSPTKVVTLHVEDIVNSFQYSKLFKNLIAIPTVEKGKSELESFNKVIEIIKDSF